MSRRALRLLAVFLLVPAGCNGSTAKVPEATPTAQIAPAGTAVPSAGAAPAASASATSDSEARMILTGRLSLTKGAQPMLGGRLLPSEAFEKRFGADWRGALEGRRVRVTGTPHVHACAPDEQCLSSGEIPLLREITMIEICTSAIWAAPRGATPVDCAPSDAEVADCMSECDAQSDACDAAADRGPGGELRRCRCARMSCRAGCELSGDAELRCR